MDLCLIGMIMMFGGPLLLLLAWPITEALVKMEETKEQKKERDEQDEPVETCRQKQSGCQNPFMQQFYDARDRNDAEGMTRALVDCKKHCSGANSWCLTEIFCPECPISGELPVRSGREGM